MYGPTPLRERGGDRSVTVRADWIAKIDVCTDPRLFAPECAAHDLHHRRLRHTIPGPFKGHVARVDGPEFLAVGNQECPSEAGAERFVDPFFVRGRDGMTIAREKFPDALRAQAPGQAGRVHLERIGGELIVGIDVRPAAVALQLYAELAEQRQHLLISRL